MRIWRWAGVVLGAMLWTGMVRAADSADMPAAVQGNGVTLFPLRYIAEWFGANVTYQREGASIILAMGQHVVQMTPGQPTALIDGHPVEMLAPAIVREGVTYVPVRFLAEALGARVDVLNGDDGFMLGVTIRDPDTGDVLLVRVEQPQPIPPLTPDGRRLHDAVAAGDLDTVTTLLDAAPALLDVRDATGMTPLLTAIAHNRPAMATLLLNRGAAVTAANLQGQTALHLAAATGQRDLLEVLIGRQARLNAKTLLGQTALHLAASAGHTEMARALLDFGAYVDAKDIFGRTPLLDAVRTNHTAMVALLLDAGALVTSRDTDWYTPLHRAAANGSAEIVTLLLRYGAPTDARAKGGKTPGELARDKGFPAVAEQINHYK